MELNSSAEDRPQGPFPHLVLSGSSVLTYSIPRQHNPDLVEPGPQPCDLGCGEEPEGEIYTKGFTDLKMGPRI